MNGAGRARYGGHPVPAPWRPNGISSDFFSPAVTFGSPWRATQIPTPEFRRTIAARRETDITPWHDHMSADRRKPADRRPMRAGRRARRGAAGREQAGRRARARDQALAGRLRPRPRQHRRGLRGSRVPRRQPVAGRGDQDPARARTGRSRPSTACRNSCARSPATCGSRGRASRWCRSTPAPTATIARVRAGLIRYVENRSDAQAAYCHARRPAGRGRHRPLARDQGICRRHDVQPGTAHRRGRGRHLGDLGRRRDPAEQGGCALLLRAGRHEPRALQGALAGRAGRPISPTTPTAVSAGWCGADFVRVVRVLGEEARDAPARAAAVAARSTI